MKLSEVISLIESGRCKSAVDIIGSGRLEKATFIDDDLGISGITLLMLLAEVGNSLPVRNLKMAKSYVNATTVNAHDDRGCSAIHYAASRGSVRRGEVVPVGDHCGFVRFLVGMGADINLIGTSDYTVFSLALENSDSEMMKCVVDNGLDVLRKDHTGFCALSLVIADGSYEIYKHIANHVKFSPRKLDTEGSPIQFLAAGNMAIYTDLVSRGMDTKTTVTESNYTIMEQAVVSGNNELFEWCLSNPRSVPPSERLLALAKKSNNRHVVNRLKGVKL